MRDTQLTGQIADIACNYDVFDFVRGQADCREGVQHQDGKGESYDAGYSCEYQLEQIQGADRGRGD